MSGRAFGAIALIHCINYDSPVAAADAPGRYEFESKHMGTTFRVVLYAPDRPTAEKSAKAVFARVDELERVMSDYDAQSELMRLCRANDAKPGQPIPVSKDLYEILRKAQEVSRKSDGAFDVTVGPLVRLWRLARRTQQLPDPKELAEAMKKVGYEKMALAPEKRTVTLKVPGMRLDLGGIGKGYAADEGLAALESMGSPGRWWRPAGTSRSATPRRTPTPGRSRSPRWAKGCRPAG